MGEPSYIRSVVDRNVVMLRITVPFRSQVIYHQSCSLTLYLKYRQHPYVYREKGYCIIARSISVLYYCM
jgi:hypothetical protein